MATKDTWTNRWVPANGGTETPITYRSGATLLYCWNAHLGKHAFLDVKSDTILDDEHALRMINF